LSCIDRTHSFTRASGRQQEIFSGAGNPVRFEAIRPILSEVDVDAAGMRGQYIQIRIPALLHDQASIPEKNRFEHPPLA